MKCLNQFIQNFSSLFKSEFEGIFSSPQVELLGFCLVLWFICLQKAFHCSYIRTSVEYICLFFESLWESIYWSNWRFIWWKIRFWWVREKPWFICYPGDDSSPPFFMWIILYCIKWYYSFRHISMSELTYWLWMISFSLLFGKEDTLY